MGEESTTLRTFKRLHLYLEDYDDVRDVDTVVYVREFLEVIRSESTSGTITGVALNSVNKFLLYNFITLTSINAALSVNMIAESTADCRFEATSASDEMVLIKLLEVSEHCLRSPAGPLLTDANVWEIVQTCFRIAQHHPASALLHRTAEATLGHIVLTLFSRLPELIAARDQARGGGAGAAATGAAASAGDAGDAGEAKAARGEADGAAGGAAGGAPKTTRQTLFQSLDQAGGMGSAMVAAGAGGGDPAATAALVAAQGGYGTDCLVQLLSFLISLTNPAHQSGTQPLGFSLINVVLETGGDKLTLVPELVNLLRRSESVV